MIQTYQDFEKRKSNEDFIKSAIHNHMQSDLYMIARDADLYDHQKNVTIENYVRTLFTMLGSTVEDFSVSNNKIPCNLFHRLNTQRCVYSLGNGVEFKDENTKEKLGNDFDTKLKKIGYNALIHGICFGFFNIDRIHVFPITEFVPLWDENDGSLRAGIRFWRVDEKKPMTAVLYEEDGYTKYRTDDSKGGVFVEVEEKKAYKTNYNKTEIGGLEFVSEENYSSLPIVPMWGSELKQSTLVGMRQAIDSFDLIRSGFANDLSDCAQIYWLVKNCGGMNEKDLVQMRDRLKLLHIASVPNADEGADIVPYAQDIPYQARKQYLDDIKAGIYEDFGALDVHTVSAGSTNDHIDAAYQPMDENADDFEYQIIEFVQGVLKLIGVEDTPLFKRNRVSNQSEQTQMILSAATVLDDETILKKLPFITVDEVDEIMKKKDTEDIERFSAEQEQVEVEEDEEEKED